MAAKSSPGAQGLSKEFLSRLLQIHFQVVKILEGVAGYDPRLKGREAALLLDVLGQFSFDLISIVNHLDKKHSRQQPKLFIRTNQDLSETIKAIDELSQCMKQLSDSCSYWRIQLFAIMDSDLKVRLSEALDKTVAVLSRCSDESHGSSRLDEIALVRQLVEEAKTKVIEYQAQPDLEIELGTPRSPRLFSR